MMSSVDDEQMSMGRDSWQQIEETSNVDVIDEMM